MSSYCTRTSHIPHCTPVRSKYDEWLNKYYIYLVRCFTELEDIIDEYEPEPNKKRSFDIFCKMVFRTSSQYISPYIENTNEFYGHLFSDVDDDGETKSV